MIKEATFELEFEGIFRSAEMDQISKGKLCKKNQDKLLKCMNTMLDLASVLVPRLLRILTLLPGYLGSRRNVETYK